MMMVDQRSASGLKERKAYDFTAEGPGQTGFDPIFIIEAEKIK